MASLASINIKFLADLKGFSSQMQNASRSINRLGKDMQRVGSQLTVGVTAPLLAMGAAGVAAWDKQEKAIAQVNAGLKTTGGTVGFTTTQLQAMAAELQGFTVFGDEDILKDVTSQLLTFTNITGDAFARTQLAALDLATRLDGDLKSASIQLGKALNDPIANLSALSRSGIQFSNEQKTVIKSLVETNRLADAQGIILDELAKQYGGSAAAAAKAGLGPFKQLGNILGDISEEFGKIIGEALLPFAEKIKNLAAGFRELSPETKKFIVIIAGVAAAVGPLLAIGGTLLPAIGTALTFITGPVGLVVAGLTAIGVVIYKNWQPIKKTLNDIANYFIDLYNESTVFRIAVEAIGLAFKNMYAIGSFIFNALGSIIGALATNIKNSFVNIGAIIKAALTFDYEAMQAALAKVKEDAGNSFSTLINNLKEDFKQLDSDIATNTQNALEAVAKRTKIKFIKDNVDATAVGEAVAEAAAAGSGSAGRSKATAITGASKGSADIGLALDAQLLVNPLDALAVAMTDSMTGIAPIFDELDEKQLRLLETAELVGAEAGAAFETLGANIVNGLGLARDGFEGFIAGLITTITKLIAMMLASSISQSIAGATASGTATGPAAIFTTPAFIATAVGGVLAAFAAIPKFAAGGIVSGPTLGIMGEYPGASSNPEVIAPLDKLKSLIGPNNNGPSELLLSGKFELEGSKLVLSYNRELHRLNRVT